MAFDVVCTSLSQDAAQHQDALEENGLRATNRVQNETAAIYTPLDSHHEEIRLVTVEQGHFTDDIHCCLAKVSINEGLSYEALSYVWGSPSSTHQIYLDRLSCLVTSNLESALRHLRYVDRPRVLWIDALCINQKSIPERNSQVRHMNSIYKKALEVIAWLGEELEDSNFAFDAFEALPKDNQMHWDPKSNPMLEELLDPKYAIAIDKIFQRSWWHRVWTFQESILGRTLRFVCGQRQIPADVLFAIKDSYLEHSNLCCYDMHLVKDPRLHTFIMSINKIDDVRQLPTAFTFQSLISTYRSRRCTDPRDKIYGLLGLADDKIVNLIVPDYSIPVAVLYEEVTIKLIEHYQNLDIFSQICAQSKKRIRINAIGLPSWVPNWTCEDSDMWFMSLHLRFLKTKYYMASAGSLPWIKSLEQGRIALHGMLFSSCAVLSTVQNFHPPRYCSELFGLWEDMTGITEQPDRLYPNSTSATYYDAYWQTLCGSLAPSRSNFGGEYQRVPDHSLSLHRSWYEAWQDWYKIYHEDPEKLSSIINEFTEAEILAFQTLVRTFIQMRKLFVSADEGWLGLAPIDAEVGDRIALLEGGKVPYILRPKIGTENEYQLIGDAYVHGIMDGEAWKPDQLTEIILV